MDKLCDSALPDAGLAEDQDGVIFEGEREHELANVLRRRALSGDAAFLSVYLPQAREEGADRIAAAAEELDIIRIEGVTPAVDVEHQVVIDGTNEEAPDEQKPGRVGERSLVAADRHIPRFQLMTALEHIEQVGSRKARAFVYRAAADGTAVVPTYPPATIDDHDEADVFSPNPLGEIELELLDHQAAAVMSRVSRCISS